MLPPMSNLAPSALAFLLAVSAGTLRSAEFVILVSVDGFRPAAIEQLRAGGELEHLARLQHEGAWTHNARSDYGSTDTVPNHVTMVTGRGVDGADGHNYTNNGSIGAADTLHANKGNYLASVFDVAHDHGLTTALHRSKSKLAIIDQSYDAAGGAPDVTGDDRPTQPAWDKIPVVHPGTPDDPGRLIGQSPHNESMLGRRQHNRGIPLGDLDPAAAGRTQVALATGETVRIVAQNSDQTVTGPSRSVHTNPYPMAGKHGNVWVVRRVDHVHPHPQNLGKERNICAQIRSWQLNLSFYILHLCPPPVGWTVKGLALTFKSGLMHLSKLGTSKPNKGSLILNYFF